MTTPIPATGLQLRSLVKPEGVLELSLATVPTPTPAADEVVVQVQAAPINPSDIGLLFGAADMSTAAQIKDSLKLGSEVLSHIGRVGKLHKRQVEQAGFAVLKAPDVPSILVETAFISNPEEEAKLRDPEYQAQLVDALATGIRRYFARNPPLARHRPL